MKKWVALKRIFTINCSFVWRNLNSLDIILLFWANTLEVSPVAWNNLVYLVSDPILLQIACTRFNPLDKHYFFSSPSNSSFLRLVSSIQKPIHPSFTIVNNFIFHICNIIHLRASCISMNRMFYWEYFFDVIWLSHIYLAMQTNIITNYIFLAVCLLNLMWWQPFAFSPLFCCNEQQDQKQNSTGTKAKHIFHIFS